MFSLFIEDFRIALEAIIANKVRSFLTLLGIVIGILAVTLMGTLISGLDRSFDKSMDFLGRDVLYISKHAWFENRSWWEIRNRPNIKPEYVDDIKRFSRYAKAVTPSVSRRVTVIRDEKSLIGVELEATTVEFLQTSTANVETGRFLTQGEIRSGSRVAVIGYNVAQELFINEDPLGKKLKLGNYSFRVIGVMEKQGKFLGMISMDNWVGIPLGTFERLFSRRGWSQILVKVDGEHIDDAKDELTGIMRRIRGLKPGEEDDFAINQQDAFRSQYNMIKFAIGGTGVFITILALVVGSIGIMNIMFVTVKERTREIGFRKAIGATRNMILGQFMLEAIIICLLGGLLGLTLSYGGSLLINKFIFPSAMPLWLALFSILLSVIVGLISGLAPSYRAAKLDPIEALRYE
ncbi:MAG: ABC transporter permease [Candidatus Marinimicrobia bacterium]|nr:ABC transporter permease [Candidatus Neomarinimicrobiota bacterium]